MDLKQPQRVDWEVQEGEDQADEVVPDSDREGWRNVVEHPPNRTGFW